jgi:HPt (histidine-containing phosphotransfer) domain-containing protein
MEDIPICNMKTLRALETEVGASTLPILIASLCEEIETSLQNFDRYYENQAWHSLEVESHALKSAALSFGAEKLSQVCREIEFTIKDNSGDAKTASLIADFKIQAALTQQHLKNLIE